MLLVSLGFACDGGETDSFRVAGKTVAGFDFKGFHVRKALPKGHACTQLATAESDACISVKGKSSRDNKCKILCSKPIAPKGKVAGFDFDGFHIRKALGKNTACAAVFTAEQAACAAVQGSDSADENCDALCNKPIAAPGQVAGFDFDGFDIRPALPIGTFCPQVALAETDACIKVGGNDSFDENCQALCDRPITRSK